MRRGTTAASFRRYQSVQPGLAACCMTTNKREEPNSRIDTFIYHLAPAGMRFAVVEPIAVVMRETLVA